MPVSPRMFVTPFLVNAGGVALLPVVLDDLWLQRIRIVIPDGHVGLTALQIQQSGVPVFPYGPDPFIRGNNEIVDFEWDAEITANGIALSGFNADIYPHEWIIRWTVTDLPAKGTPIQIVSAQTAALSTATVAAVAGLAGVAGLADAQSPDQLTAAALAGAVGVGS